MSRIGVGIDFGGTKIEAVALETAPGAPTRIRATRRIPTPRDDYDGSIRAVRDLAAQVRAEAGAPPGPVGVSMPGALRPADGRVMNANSTWLNGRRFRDDLEAAMGAPVRAENDANCLALSEILDGAAAGAGCVFAVILGTGVGGGLAARGRLWSGASAIAGEWGHNRLPEPRDDERPGPSCYCGRRGCIETWLSGPGLAADYARATPEAAPASAEEIAARADAGDAAAAAALARHVERAGRALAAVVNIVDPDAIILGGGVSNLSGFAASVRAATAPHVFSDDWRGVVRLARHGDSSGVRGAARLWSDEEESAE